MNSSPLIVSKPKTWLVAPQVLDCEKLSLVLLTSFTSTSGYEVYRVFLDFDIKHEL